MKDQSATVKYRKDYQAPHFFIETTALTFQLEEESTQVINTMTLRRNKNFPNQPLALHGEQLKLRGLKVNGMALTLVDYRVNDEQLIINAVPDEFTIEIHTEINPKANTSLEGLYLSSGNFCTQCEAEGFRKITYYLDRPDVMATFTTRVEADKASYPVLLSNGNCIESGDLEDGRHYAVWEDPFKKPSYLFALVAGNLVSHDDEFVTQSGRRVELRLFVEAENRDKTDHAMESLKQSMKWDEETYGLEYDLDIYMIVAVNDFNMGAMENKGLNVFNSKYVLAKPETATDTDYEGIQGVIGHEYFHNWTGNRVTCRDWFQLSLKEGLTVFRDEQFTADHTSHAVKRISDVKILRSHQFAEDSGPMAHPVRPDSYIEMNNFYTVTVYNKGAEVVRMYHTLLGADGFRKGMDLYFERHDGQAVTCDDFRAAMADANGADLTQFERWYSQAGTPELHISDEYNQAENTYSLTVKQSCPATPEQDNKAPFLIPLRIALLDADGEEAPLDLGEGLLGTETVLTVTEAEQRFTFQHVANAPVPSLLRGFSAPVRMFYDYSDEQLTFLMAHDKDPFNRWEASQTLASKLIHQNQLSDDNETLKAYLAACENTLKDDMLEPSLKALAITLPSEQELIDQCKQADVDAIISAREQLKRLLARTHNALWADIYEQLNHNAPYTTDAAAVGKRRLKNLALSYLCLCKSDADQQRVVEQFSNANNMTDSISALACLANTTWASRDNALTSFYERWKDDPLVLDKWFTTQACANRAGVLDDVKALMQHEKFTLKNPNRVRSLVGAFASANVAGFHQADGTGYKFLADQIIALNTINPQIAARLCTPLTRWRKFDEKRQALMQTELKRIMETEDLSKDVFEMVSKSLG